MWKYHRMPRHTDVADLVAEAAAGRGDRLALVEVGGRTLTWSQLEDQVARFATGLGDLGVIAGQRVMLVLGNRLEFVVAYLGTLRAQAVAVPVNPASPADDLLGMVADSGPRLVVAEAATLPTVREAVGRLRSAMADPAAAAAEEAEGVLEPGTLARAVPSRVVTVDEEAGPDETPYADLAGAPAKQVPPLQDPDKLAALLYTSGTSGRPRAAMLTHRALLANVEQTASLEPPMVHGDDVVLGVLPLFHIYGLNAVLGTVLRHGAKLVLSDRFDPEGTLDLIEDEAVSVLPVAPPVFGYWLQLDQLRERLGPVRLVLSGSAPLAAEVIEAFTARTGLPVHQGYGLTEAAPVVTSTLFSPTPKNGSAGAPLPGIEVRVVDERHGQPEREDPGEIQVRGDNLFSGYWPDGADAPGPDGWWATGDVGYLDADGDLFLVDPVEDLVIVSGFNVYPSEVEEVIRSIGVVDQVAVVGAKDETTGQAVVAYVVAEGVAAAELEAAVREHVSTRLARFKQPSRIEVVDSLPTSLTGRVQKGRLRGIERRRALGLLE